MIENLKKRQQMLAGEVTVLRDRINEAGEAGPSAEDMQSLRKLTDEAVELREQIDTLERADKVGTTQAEVTEYLGKVQAEAQRQGVPIVQRQDTGLTFHKLLEQSRVLGQQLGIELDTTGVWRAIAYAREGLDPKVLVSRIKEGMRLRPEGDDALDTRTLTVGTDSQGGYLVDDVTVTSVILDWWLRSPMMGISKVIPTRMGNPLSYPIADTPTPVTAPTTEGSAFTTKEPGFNSIDFGAYKYTGLAAASDELLQDAPMVSEEAIRHALIGNLTQATENAFVNGTGSSQPHGVLRSSQDGLGSSEATMGTISTYSTAWDLSARTSHEVILKGLVEALYTNIKSEGASKALRWIMPRQWYGAIVACLFDSHGPAFAGGMSFAPMPAGMLLGVPVTMLDHGPALPASASADNVRFGAVGVFSEAFGIRVVSGGWKILVNPYRRRNEGLIEYQADVRVDSQIMLPDAIATVRGPTYTG